MSLVERLAEKLNVPLDEGDRRLDEFITNVQRHLDEEGEVDLPGIGTFRQSADGEIDFTAAPSLAAIANYRFGGLSPVRMTGEYGGAGKEASENSDVPEAAADSSAETADEETDSSEDVPADQPVSSEADESAGETFDEEVEQFWDEDRGESPLGSRPDEGYEETSFSVIDEGDAGDDGENGQKSGRGGRSGTDASGDRSGMSGADEELTEEGEAREQAAGGSEEEKMPAQRAFPRKPRSPRGSSRTTLGIVAVVLIATGAVLLMYYAWSGTTITASDTSSSPTEQTAGAPGAADDDTTSEAQEASEASSDAGPASGPSPFDAPLQSDEGIQPEYGGQTWVIASLADRSAAENLRDTYAANGFRTSIFRGGAGYRVAVGQFRTRETALATRERLPSDVASAAWIMEIQSNM